MSVIHITSLSGQSPFNITICDKTKTYCELVATGVGSVPPVLDLTIPSNIKSDTVLVIAEDSTGCEQMIVVKCSTTPTPTPTIQPTPTVTPTPNKCKCYTLINPTSDELGFEITLCNGDSLCTTIDSYTNLYFCGYNPSIESPGYIEYKNFGCDTGVCPEPDPTPTPTPTITPSLPPMVASFVSCCDPSVKFTVYNIPLTNSPIGGIYYVDNN